MSDYYGLSGDPFNKHFNNPSNFYSSRDYVQALSRLNHLKEVRGLGVISAAPGMGKSLVLKNFALELNPNLYKVLYTSLSTLTVGEFYRQLCDDLGISDARGKAQRISAIKRQIEYMYHEKKQTFIFIIDEAQYLSPGILTDLKILMNFRYDSLNCFALILSGESYLCSTLNKPIHISLKQRIIVHYEYEGLKGEEIKDYVLHKIRMANGSESIIDPSAFSALHSYSSGNPRVIDNLMSDALIIGEQQGKKVIDSEVILSAAENRSL